ncbi:CBS domain-containing protein [Phaeobacter sp. QD34_3]|uniref:CBS domain-containing protein n=1 Tax=unclassified Phaeobacter TaxID=2621772 RepID=UPI00237FB808|nr:MULTISPECIES: CBS domain-containing protein [unclassified Phaeobacter]MDE4132456.1 CBS domain-containing protein [Phaeobacter sp. QD34_3]MDE4136093.1 CBS domain-containing protein [Phaeobacter sp. QD34_24]
MPTSYQAPMRKDKDKKGGHSQTPSSNLQPAMATVADILNGKGNEVFSISPDETLHRAVELLRDKRIGALLATDETGALCGVLSERDIVRKLADAPGRTLPQLVRDVMTRKVETCSPADPLLSVLKRMTAGRFRHMPVTADGKLTGMITIGDVVNFRLTQLEHEALQMKQLIVG